MLGSGFGQKRPLPVRRSGRSGRSGSRRVRPAVSGSAAGVSVAGAAAGCGGPAAGVATDAVELAGSGPSANGLTEADVGNLNAVLEHEVARNTIKNYRIQWKGFTTWASRRGVTALPADPSQVASYLAERIEQHGHRPATLRVAAAAIAFVHRTAGVDNPCASPQVKRTLQGATRKAGRSQRQAEALTAEALAVIEPVARNRRRGRSGQLESPHTAEKRGNLDVALIRLMRDAMLRISEAAALSWDDIQTQPDGTGRLLIRSSKTDRDGEGFVAFLSAQTMAAVELVRNGATGSDSIFGLHPSQIARRIKKAAQAAGLGDGFSGHSPRVGMARDLVRAGVELPA